MQLVVMHRYLQLSQVLVLVYLGVTSWARVIKHCYGRFWLCIPPLRDSHLLLVNVLLNKFSLNFLEFIMNP